jgi:HSP20 family protein
VNAQILISVKILAQKKSSEKKENTSHEKKTAATKEKKELTPAGPRRGATGLALRRSPDLMRDFDRVFERFRSDFEDLLWPSERVFRRAFSMLPGAEMRALHVDLEDRGKDFMLKAEMPGFKKEDVEIEVQDDSVEIRGETGWKQEEEKKNYVVRERGSESFYRIIKLPEEVKADSVEANLKDGVLEITLPKKAPKQRRKIAVK